MENEAIIRLSVFVGLFVTFALIEWPIPRRKRTQPRPTRWFTNVSLVVIDTLTLRLLALALPVLAVGAAVDAQKLGLGLFNWLNWHIWVQGLLTILIFDFAIWFQHLITYKTPTLWLPFRRH